MEKTNDKIDNTDLKTTEKESEMNTTEEKIEEVKAEVKKTTAEKAKELKTKKLKSTKDKIKELEGKIKKLEEENNKLKDQNVRKIAEFENFKRRTEKEFLAYLEFANESLITDLLPVIDDFERSLEHAKNAENNDSLIEGIELIYKKMMSVLEKKGLKVIEAVGQEFNTEKHQALMQVESDKFESGYVVEEHLKGYTLNDRVIRHSQVLVSK